MSSASKSLGLTSSKDFSVRTVTWLFLPLSGSFALRPMTVTSWPASRNALYGSSNSESSKSAARTHAILMAHLLPITIRAVRPNCLSVAASIFEPVGDGRFVATAAALSPWSDQSLHGSPVAMLLAREVERFPAEQPMFVTRLTVELLRAFGRIPVEVRARLVRPGRKVQIVEASLWNGEQEVGRATALRIRTSDVAVPDEPEDHPHDPPESLQTWAGGWRPGAEAYHLIGVENRSPADFEEPGPHFSWFRLRVPLIPGEEPTGLIRVCAAADFPNGISRVVDPRQISFVNPDVTLYLHRHPVDEWVMVDGRTWLEPNGVGVAEGALYDRRGRIGRSLQSLLVEPR